MKTETDDFAIEVESDWGAGNGIVFSFISKKENGLLRNSSFKMALPVEKALVFAHQTLQAVKVHKQCDELCQENYNV